jgi:hypothetical protein
MSENAPNTRPGGPPLMLDRQKTRVTLWVSAARSGATK